MMVTKLAKRKFLAPFPFLVCAIADITSFSIIQDCEDALTNWVTANAAVKPKLSTRARNLSQRRHQHRDQGEGVDLSGQDSSMKDNRESGLWVPAGAHREYQNADDDEEEEEEEEAAPQGEARGRDEEREASHA